MLIHVHQDRVNGPWRPWYTEFDKIPSPPRAVFERAEKQPGQYAADGIMRAVDVMAVEPRWGWIDV